MQRATTQAEAFIWQGAGCRDFGASVELITSDFEARADRSWRKVDIACNDRRYSRRSRIHLRRGSGKRPEVPPDGIGQKAVQGRGHQRVGIEAERLPGR